MDSRGYMLSPGDFFKGLMLGLIVGALIGYLFAMGIIPNPLLSGGKP